MQLPYDIKPDAVVDLRGVAPANPPEISGHRHVVVEWEGGTVWLDMSAQTDHYCIDVRQFDPAGEEKGQGVFTIVNGRQAKMDKSLTDAHGTRVTGHGWDGGYVITLLAG